MFGTDKLNPEGGYPTARQNKVCNYVFRRKTMVAILFCLFPKKSFGLFGSPVQRAPFRVVANACSEWERSNKASASIFAKQIRL